MFQLFSTLILIGTLALGAGGLTTAAAQASLPGQPLYALKLWSEQTRLGFAAQANDWQLALSFAERRAAELRQMAEAGMVPSEDTQVRLQLQLENTIGLALGGDSDDVTPALEHIRLRLEAQERAMLALQGAGSPAVDAALTRARQTIQVRIGWVEAGIQEPDWLREQFRLRLLQPLIPATGQPFDHPGLTPPASGDCSGCTSQAGSQRANPWTTGTPTPGSGYGEGQGSNPWTTGTPAPGSRYGDGQGENPRTTDTLAPGSSYTPGPGSPTTPPDNTGLNPSAEPTRDQAGSAPQATQPNTAGNPTPEQGGGPQQGGGGGQGSQPPGGGGKP